MLKRCDVQVQERGLWKKRWDSEGQKQGTDNMPRDLTLGKTEVSPSRRKPVLTMPPSRESSG